MVAYIYRGKVNLQMDFYFANNTIVIRDARAFVRLERNATGDRNAGDKNAEPP